MPDEKNERPCPSGKRPSGKQVDKMGYNGAVSKHRAKVLMFSSMGRQSSPLKTGVVLGRVLAFPASSSTALCRGQAHGIPTCSSQTLYWPIQTRLRCSTGGSSSVYSY